MVCREEHVHGDECDHSSGPDRGTEFTLHNYIDMHSIIAYNIVQDESKSKIFKTWENRFDIQDYIQSDADEQILIDVAFTGSVKLKSIGILGFNDDSQPSELKVIINRDDVDFDSVDSVEPTQTWSLVQHSPEGIVPEYQTKLTKFTNVRRLTMYFTGNFGEDFTRISYIGFKGDFTALSKDPVITIYESAPNPLDHKKMAMGENSSSQFIQ